VFTTGGSVNPTLTLVALAMRLGEHLRRVLA
jgi:choline dehydrogenase-like flavoprotein